MKKGESKTTRTYKIQMKNDISKDDVDVHYFLCSGKSLSQHERDRLATGFTTREESTVREKTQNEKNKGLKNKKTSWPIQFIQYQ